jgi:hypothetical protein
MKSELQVVKSLVKKYSNDKELGSAVRRFLTEDYWIRKSNTLRVLEYRELKEFKSLATYGQDHIAAEREWLEQLDKI